MRELLVAGAVFAPFLVGASVAPDREGDEVFRFQDPAIVESSGLVVRDGLVVTVNDSGDGARVFTVDLRDGSTVGVTEWDDDPHDLEALAPAGRGQVWVADTGDNLGNRTSVTVTRVPVGRGDRSVDGEQFELTYPDGPNDAEALLAHPVTGRLYVVTKGVLAGRIHEAPATLSASAPNPLTPIGDAPGLVTDGAFFPDGRHLVLRNYGKATVLTFPGLAEVAEFQLPSQQQGEGIAVAPDGQVYLSSEGARSPLLRLRLPDDVRRAVTESTPSSTPSPSTSSPAPSDTSQPAGPSDWQDSEPESDVVPDREVWPWLVGGLLFLLCIGVLVRSLRPS